ncbi:MAG: O-antigen ligase family protein [Steroidobacteraceae bacterium]
MNAWIYPTSQVLTKLMFGILVLGLATGFYTLKPIIAYIFVLCAMGVLLSDHKFFRSPLLYVDLKMFVGFLIYNIFFFIHSLFFLVEARIYFVHIVSLGIFLLMYVYTRLVILDQDPKKLNRAKMLIFVYVLCSLVILLCGQLAEMLGYINPRMLDLDDGIRTYLIRPGGFLNPNVTAAISLILLFISERCNSTKKIYIFLIPLVLTLIIIFLSQSRAGILALLFYLAYLTFIRRSFPFLVLSITVVVLISLGLIFSQIEVLNLFDRVVTRFSGDESSSTRWFLLRYGAEKFLEAPLLGNGYRYMTGAVGWSAHNEIIENLVNFGILGAVIIVFAIYLLYWPTSSPFIFFCIMPMFMFTHNFFETTSFQASLGVALAIDRIDKYVKFR